MVFVEIDLSDSYWKSLNITQEDIEFLYAFLLEKETPMTSESLAEALIHERIRSEEEKLQEKQKQNGKIYLPKSEYAVGDQVQFPAMNWVSGKVTDLRAGNNPEQPNMKVITVDLENGGTRQFAANLEEHALNDITTTSTTTDEDPAEMVFQNFGSEITTKLEEKLNENKDIVRIGADWFPKSLLIEFNVGHLNLAEAVLDMKDGGPLSVDTLLDQIDVETDDPQELIEFSLNYALQEDPRFDDVGPSGVVQWFLNRLEPEYVREKPLALSYTPVDYDRSILTDEMLAAEPRIDDELIDEEYQAEPKASAIETTIALIYPHWRTGSLPLTAKIRPFFPTALESPRVKFKLIDHHGDEISAWVVRPYNYIYGLKDWYRELELMPGSLINIKPGKNPGEVLIKPEKKRSSREWIRTLLIGADGGIVFAMLKQTITADFNERMAVAVPSTKVLDELWQKRAQNPWQLKDEIIRIMRELAKLNPQGHVHGLELYAALNCIRRCPPAVIFSQLASEPEFSTVGDLYFRMSEGS
jgi:hypothetical protein